LLEDPLRASQPACTPAANAHGPAPVVKAAKTTVEMAISSEATDSRSVRRPSDKRRVVVPLWGARHPVDIRTFRMACSCRSISSQETVKEFGSNGRRAPASTSSPVKLPLPEVADRLSMLVYPPVRSAHRPAHAQRPGAVGRPPRPLTTLLLAGSSKNSGTRGRPIHCYRPSVASTALPANGVSCSTRPSELVGFSVSPPGRALAPGRP